ncbi:MAG TPA: ATP-dependent DNA ligase, partial [Geminicoccaceae bacterium]
LAGYWDELDTGERFLLNKLIGGSFRVGVSKLLVQRALAEHGGVDAKLVAQRMMGYTDTRSAPGAERFIALTASGEGGPLDTGQPYPFFLAHQLDVPADGFAAKLGDPRDWIVEWKYDGIRAQIVKRRGEVWIWSRGEELVTDRFPEVVQRARRLPDGTVLDGEIVVWKDGAVQPFALLQQRIGRKVLARQVLDAAPVGFIAYDVLEWQGRDRRDAPQRERRALLERIVAESHAALAAREDPAAADDRLHLSPVETRPDWLAFAELRTEARARGVEGFMLKHADARYGTGRRKQDDLSGGTWWKWKLDPLVVDCILVYAQAGHGRRASVYTDYTFAVWNRRPRDRAEADAVLEAIARKEPIAGPDALQLVAFAKAYSGLTDAEFRAVDRIIRRDTLEKFGPVRSVKPSMVFELGFEGINRSTRHKSGIATRFPRMLRIRDDKLLYEADTMEELEALLALHHGNAAEPEAEAAGPSLAGPEGP